MPTGNTIPARVWFHPTLILTEPEKDLAAWYFSSLPIARDNAAPRPGAEVSDRPEVSLLTPPDGPMYIGIPIAAAILALVAALTGCGSTRSSLDRQLAAAQVAAERTTADRALAAERARVQAIHGGLR
jgi:hypothetical protein